MTAAQAAAHVMSQTAMMGVQVIIPRRIIAKEIVRVRHLPQLVGWRHYPDANGKRPVYGGTKKFQDDPHWKDYILFYEYFHGDNGAGLGASHQTGWTGLIARSLDMFGRLTATTMLAKDKADIIAETTRQQVAG